MRKGFILFIVFLNIMLVSCKKESGNVSPETKSLLQNKWTLISSSVVFPANTSLNSAYKGVSTDYYYFGSNDSLIISQAGQANLPTIPLSLTVEYSFVNNNSMVYSLLPATTIQIQTLTNNLLVLSNSATHTVINSGVVVATYDGTKVDSLKR